jgi:hypothetical protein
VNACSIGGCRNKHKARGWCEKHYKRFLEHGDPNLCLIRRENHGMSTSKDYGRWSSMLYRCYNSNSACYRHYGGRGIGVYELWRNSFVAYKKYIDALPHSGIDGLTLDRINNDGNYEPGNLRWATRSEQCLNQRRHGLMGNSTSGITGINFHKKANRWFARKTINGARVFLGSFESKEEAIEALYA